MANDVINNGVCDLSQPQTFLNLTAGVYPKMEDALQAIKKTVDPYIFCGTCSDKTEEVLKENECKQFILQRPPIILNTVIELIRTACTKEVSKKYVRIRVQYDEKTCGCTKEQFANVTGNFLNTPCCNEEGSGFE